MGLSIPLTTVNDAANMLFGDAVFESEFTLQNTTRRITSADFVNLLFGQFGMGVRFTMRMTAFFAHVAQVVVTCTQKEMGGIDAGWIVATVADKKVVGDRSKMKFVGNTVRATALVAMQLYLTVTFAVKRALPFPAIVGAAFAYLFPEANGKRASGSGLMAANVFALLAWKLGNGDGLITTAGATYDTITHVEKLLSAFGQSRGRYQRRSAISIGSTGVIVPQIGVLAQARRAQ